MSEQPKKRGCIFAFLEFLSVKPEAETPDKAKPSPSIALDDFDEGSAHSGPDGYEGGSASGGYQDN